MSNTDSIEALNAVLAVRLRDSREDRVQDIVRRNPKLRRMSDTLRAEIESNRQGLLAALESSRLLWAVADHMAEGFFAFLCDHYQYMELGSSERGELAALYRQFALEFRDWLGQVPDLDFSCPPLVAHHGRLTFWTRRALDGVGALGWAETSERTVVCSSYSPELQLQVLRLDVADLAEPILDLGCGREAHLVRYLRSLGLEAFGIDRLAEPAPGVSRSSWFEAQLGEAAWGTIVAHHSFSLHFLNAHTRNSARAAQFGRRYMHILRALRPRGRFAYAPGLPFIEGFLDPRDYQSVSASIPLLAVALRDGRGGVDWKVTQVTRR